MHADLRGSLNQLNKSYKAFEHRNNKMSKREVKAVLEYGLKKGYKTTAELSDDEVDKILFKVNKTKPHVDLPPNQTLF